MARQVLDEGLFNSFVAPDEYRSAWYFSRKELESFSPSRKDGIDWRMEDQLRMSYCSFIQNLGMELRMPQLTIATAIMFCHRFYLRQSHAKNDWKTVATACIFLASKDVETPCLLDKVVVVAYKMIHRKDPAAALIIHSKEVFAKQKDLILVGETLLLSTIGFDLNIQHPYAPLIAVGKKFKLQNDVMKTAWNFVNDWLRSTMCLQYKPHYIAAGSLYLAAKLNNMQLPSQRGYVWWHEFDVSPRQLQEVIQQMTQDLGFKQRDLAPCAQGSTVAMPMAVKAASASSTVSVVLSQAGSTKRSGLASGDGTRNKPMLADHNQPSSCLPASKDDVNTKAESQCKTRDSESPDSMIYDGDGEGQARMEPGRVISSKVVCVSMNLGDLDRDRTREKLKRRREERETKKAVMTTDCGPISLERKLEASIELGRYPIKKRHR